MPNEELPYLEVKKTKRIFTDLYVQMTDYERRRVAHHPKKVAIHITLETSVIKTVRQ